ncbi:MAG TPA: ABC transporter permease [Vicinamibacterales bacterium]|nr:ABC transporter permease [Vicinamibacterales bacterium]
MSALNRFRNLFRSKALQRDLDDEIQFHIDRRLARNLRAGMSPEQARTDARRRFGNVTRLSEEMREARVMTWLESLARDLQYGIRSLRRERLATAAVMVMLALGIGGNAAIFTLFNAVWLQPLPYRDPGRIVTLQDAFPKAGVRETSPTVPEFLDVRGWNRSFEEMAFLDHRDLQITGGPEPERAFGVRVTASFFPLLGVEPALGRVFASDDNRPGNERVVILSDGFWRRAMAADPAIVGRTLRVDGRPYQVVGVLPAGFSFDHPGIGIREPADVYVPFLMNDYYTLRSGEHSHLRRVLALARLKPGVELPDANAELRLLAQRLATDHPDLYRSRPSGEDMGFTMNARPLQDTLSGESSTVLLLLLGAVGIVLLIACANTAQFLLARSLQRQDEVVIRVALGATRRRLVQQFLAEALTLAAAGGALGFWSSQIFVDLLVARIPARSPLLDSAGVDMTVVAFTLGATVLTAILCGVLPAFTAFGAAGRRLLWRAPRSRHRSRSVLVAVEVALSIVLLASAAVLLRGLHAIGSAPRGFSPDDVTVMQLRLTQVRPDLRGRPSAQYQEYLARIAEIPGVDAAAVMSGQPVPLTDASFVIGPHAGDAGTLARRTARQIVSPDFFRALRIPLVEGRTFTVADMPDRPAVAIVNAELARRLWPNESAIGKQLRVPRPATIVGVVGSTRMRGTSVEMPPQIYVPSLQHWEPNASLAVRSAAGTAPPIEAIKQAVRSVAPDQAIFNIRSLNQALSVSQAEPRFRTLLLGAFAALALILSATGVYSLVSYLVSGRTRELAIRIAIGAQRSDVFWLVTGQTLVWTAAGVAAGLAAAVILNRLLGSSLTSVAHLDGATLLSVSALYLLMALTAAGLPARRTFRLDPVRALKAE